MPRLELSGLSPLLFGTGRPFSTEPGALTADSHSVPMPHTLAGAFRNELARRQSPPWLEFEESRREALLQVSSRGPILLNCGKPMFPCPADAVAIALGGDDLLAPSRPRPNAQGVLLPDGLCATDIRKESGWEPSKREHLPFWSAASVARWLAHPGDGYLEAKEVEGTSVPIEARIHVQIELGRRAAQEGQLFTTQGACLTQCLMRPEGADDEASPEVKDLSVAAEVDVPSGVEPNFGPVLTLGGERRLAAVYDASAEVFECPDLVRKALGKHPAGIRLLLATPALFKDGWCRRNIEIEGVALELVAACVGRRVAVAGWAPHVRPKDPGEPKPLRWAAPAGSVYFYKVRSGDPVRLADHWLRSICEEEQDRRDGFGLALWGVWEGISR